MSRIYRHLKHGRTCNHWKKKCWDDVMAVIEFCPLSPLYNFDRSHLVNFLVGTLNIVWGGRGGLGWRSVQVTCTLLFEKHGLKLALAVRKTKIKMDRASQLIFPMIVGCLMTISKNRRTDQHNQARATFIGPQARLRICVPPKWVMVC